MNGIVWQGIALGLGKEWVPEAVEGSWNAGSLHLVGGDDCSASVTWRKAPKGLTPDSLVKRYRDSIRKRLRSDSNTEEISLAAWIAEDTKYQPYTLDGFAARGEKMVAVLAWRLDQRVVQAVFQLPPNQDVVSFCREVCHPISQSSGMHAGSTQEWCLGSFQLRLSGSFSVGRQEFGSSRERLQFKQGLSMLDIACLQQPRAVFAGQTPSDFAEKYLRDWTRGYHFSELGKAPKQIRRDKLYQFIGNRKWHLFFQPPILELQFIWLQQTDRAFLVAQSFTHGKKVLDGVMESLISPSPTSS